MTSLQTPKEQELNEIDQLKTHLRSTWMTGNYDKFSRFMEQDAETFFRRLDIAPGSRLLDVGCGAGQIALIAARNGVRATGCDIAVNWLEQARARAAAEGLQVDFGEGDAEALPYPDGAFDIVTSLFGAMFAPRPDLVAAELTRVCRPGGLIAMANWTPSGFIGQMFRAVAAYIAPANMPSPVLWGQEATVRRRFAKGIADLKCTRRLYRFEYPFPPEEVVEFYRANYGLVGRAFAALDDAGHAKLRADLVRLWSAHNQAGPDTTRVDSEYLEVIAIREPETDQSPAARRSVRAAALADRIEAGAAALAAFAEQLSGTEWQTPVSTTDGRTVGVIVHHVASMYPIEVDVARKVAVGTPVLDVTWEAVAGINAAHARENRAITKGVALDLLRRNSREAAAAVRQFSDAELDRAAPFSLSFGAPMTAQFVIEDHALRHSWHHLAGIRKALGR